MTKGGPAPNKECMLPFAYSHTILSVFINYSDIQCALDHVGKPWCPTKLDPNGVFDASIRYKDGERWKRRINKNWGYCGDDCEIVDLPAGDYRSFLHYDVQTLFIILS